MTGLTIVIYGKNLDEKIKHKPKLDMYNTI